MAVKVSEWDRDRPEPPRLQVREPGTKGGLRSEAGLWPSGLLWEVEDA